MSPSLAESLKRHPRLGGARSRAVAPHKSQDLFVLNQKKRDLRSIEEIQLELKLKSMSKRSAEAGKPGALEREAPALLVARSAWAAGAEARPGMHDIPKKGPASPTTAGKLVPPPGVSDLAAITRPPKAVPSPTVVRPKRPRHTMTLLEEGGHGDAGHPAWAGQDEAFFNKHYSALIGQMFHYDASR